ncbi:hypothetical protein [Halosimplex halophilum]|nr:hypothetical protein [Halosimplex halophilum]
MLCIIAPEYASRGDETRDRSADDESEDGTESEEDPSDGELLPTMTV